ncbi:DNA/RNA nuclease SfsA [Desulfurivibrio sp. D14AmB]|uniref:DNA/RNA nuclease SfsA n=1 Tax=Desulfurivibrio sp. D14AmB TaxID=3374370 RepID=UPI00376EB671
MDLPPHLIRARMIRRYQRFLADVRLEDGRELTVHCPNSGSMLGCIEENGEVVLSVSTNPGRKYPHTLELVKVAGVWVGINTARSNALAREALENGVIRELQPLAAIRAEVKVSAHSRLDFLLDHGGGRLTYLEVKNCTLAEDGLALFPDAVTSRGTRHLGELLSLVQAGHGAALLFCVQRGDVGSFAPAGRIDPAYAAALGEAAAGGVRILAYRAAPTPGRILLDTPLPVRLSP